MQARTATPMLCFARLIAQSRRESSARGIVIPATSLWTLRETSWTVSLETLTQECLYWKVYQDQVSFPEMHRIVTTRIVIHGRGWRGVNRDATR